MRIVFADTGDLTVASLGSFFVADAGKGGVLVHNSGAYKKQFNPLTPLDDIVIPVRGDNGTRVEPMSGAGNMGEIADLNYNLRKFFGSARVPPAYFGQEGEINSKCLHTSIRIPCLNGTTQTLGSIIRKYKKTGYLPWVYAWDKNTGKIVAGEVTWAGITARTRGSGGREVG